jgi:hypothetical protein
MRRVVPELKSVATCCGSCAAAHRRAKCDHLAVCLTQGIPTQTASRGRRHTAAQIILRSSGERRFAFGRHVPAERSLGGRDSGAGEERRSAHEAWARANRANGEGQSRQARCCSWGGASRQACSVQKRLRACATLHSCQARGALQPSARIGHALAKPNTRTPRAFARTSPVADCGVG